jgi:hypothetical protein
MPCISLVALSVRMVASKPPTRQAQAAQLCFYLMRRFFFFEYLALSIFVYFGILSICITPNMPVAYMFSGTVYFSECCTACQS